MHGEPAALSHMEWSKKRDEEERKMLKEQTEMEKKGAKNGPTGFESIHFRPLTEGETGFIPGNPPFHWQE